MPRLDPEQLINSDNFSDTMKLVHLAARFDSTDIEEWRTMLLRQRRSAYEQELSIQLSRVGCSGQTGRLENGPILSQLNEMAVSDAESIANTFNYFLAAAIINIREEVPTANRNTYASRIASWESTYWGWKQAQIDETTDTSARSLAQQNFYSFNNQNMGTAELIPKTAKCPICQGWIQRGTIPLSVAMANPPPYHVHCPHVFNTNPEKVAKEECAQLWAGR